MAHRYQNQSHRESTERLMNHDLQSECPARARRYARYEFETDLTVTILGMEGSETARGCSLNINEAGIAGLFAAEWDLGASVNLQFSVPFTSTPVRVRAIVRNRTSYQYGFEFIDLTPEHSNTINRTCRMLGLFL
jgi:PilZ domain